MSEKVMNSTYAQKIDYCKYCSWSSSSNSWFSFLNSTMWANTYSRTCLASCALLGSLAETPRISAHSLKLKSLKVWNNKIYINVPDVIFKIFFTTFVSYLCKSGLLTGESFIQVKQFKLRIIQISELRRKHCSL